MTNKQAQIQMAFLIAFVSIIIIFGVLIGVRQIKQMQQNALKAETTNFVLELKSTIQEITEQYGNTRKISLKAPKSIYEICLVDEKLFENKTLLRQYCENLGLETYYFEKKYVCSIIEEDVKKNLFFFPTQQNQYVGPLSLQNPITCIPANENNFNLLVAGLGDTSIVVEVNPVQVQGCSSDDDCGDGEHCDGGVCTKDEGCSSDDDCGGGEHCDGGVCTKDEGCTSNTDCPGEVCNTETGECVECLSDNDCESNEKCSEHVCVDLECEYLGQKHEDGEKWCSEDELCTCNIKDHKAEVSCVECTNGCTTSSGIAACEGTTCGNNQKEDGEVCDGSDLNGKSCSNFTDDYGFSFTGGTLQCKDDCSGFDTSLCKNSNIKKYTISYNKASIACFWDRTKVESCSDFADEITEMFDTGHPGRGGSTLITEYLLCGEYADTTNLEREYFDFVIIHVPGHGVPQVNKINVKRGLGLSSPISISPDLNYDHSSSDGGVVCYELCKPKHRGNEEVTLVVNTRKPELISVEKNHDCILCPVWNSKFYCVQSVFCLSPIGEVQDNKECGGDDEVCCKITPNMCPADNDQYEGCKETCSPGYIEDEGRYCPDNKKCCKKPESCNDYNILNDGYHYMCQDVTRYTYPEPKVECEHSNLGYVYFKSASCPNNKGCCKVKTCESAGGVCRQRCRLRETQIFRVYCDTGVCCEISGGGGGGSNYRCSGSCFYRECPEDYVEISGNCPGEGRVCCKHEVHRNPTSCFPAGTLVFMADGTYKPIETVKSGDYVVSYDFKTGENVKAKVLEVEKPIRYHMYTLTFNDSSVLKLTNEHPIYVKNKGWSSISPEVTWETHHLIVNKLEVGDKIVKVNGTVVLMNISYKEYPEGIQTYNLKTILHHHNYYADGVLVHNKCPPNC